MIPFGPQLIGQTEKALNAVLGTLLARHHLSEAQWVSLKLTAQFDGGGSLTEYITGQAHFPDAAAQVSTLTDRGLIAGDRLTDTGRETVDEVGRRIAELTGPVWAGLDSDELAAAERTLNLVLERTRTILRTH
ncbi:hypothetical protein [Ruania rhizosphaerae]|uniref:hypothetical protein n=1 Tax=Ruania rhizosphaerae TaxID=1840413 RepID=UPI00135835C1|nr:hypothetical protein [Ruania rhizosphaerae]